MTDIALVAGRRRAAPPDVATLACGGSSGTKAMSARRPQLAGETDAGAGRDAVEDRLLRRAGRGQGAYVAENADPAGGAAARGRRRHVRAECRA